MPEKRKMRRQENKKSISIKLPDVFYSDCSMPEMLYAAIVRSPYAYGKITNINIRDLPEGYFFFTARDLPGRNIIHTLNSDTNIFCTEKVHYIGEPVGIIAGPDPQTVRRLSSEIQITFDVSTIESALKLSAADYTHPVIKMPGMHYNSRDNEIAEFVDMMNILPALDALPKPQTTISYTQPSQIKNIVGHTNTAKKEPVIIAERIIKTGIFNKKKTPHEKIFQTADFDITGTWTQKICTPQWSETGGAFCFMEDGILNIFTTTQWPAYLQKALSDALNIDEDRIAIRKTVTPNKKPNGLWRNTTLTVQTALAAVLTGRPVKLILTKDEQNRFMQPGTNVQVTHRTAVSGDGTIKAMKINIQTDAGYCNPFATEITDRLAIAACSIYNPENLYVCARVYTSPNPPTSIYPEMIDSQSFFAVENHIQQIADKMNILPLELRLKNLCLDQHKLKSPFFFKLAKPEETMQAIITQSDFNRKYTAFRLDSQRRMQNRVTSFFALPWRGIGLACAFDGSGYYGSNNFACSQKMEVTFETDSTLTIHSPVPSEAIAEIWKKTAADILQIETDSIRITSDFENREAVSLPENIYNNVSIMSQLLKRCCTEIQHKRFHSPLPITSKKGITPTMRKQWDNETFSGTPFHTTSFGAAVVEVELDSYTFREKIKGIWLAIDCGEVYSLRAAERTIRLAIQQELTELVSDETVPCGAIKISFVKSNNNPGQIGSLVHNLIPAAFTSALSLALAAQVTELPCSEELLYNLTQKPAALHEEETSEPEDKKTDNKNENAEQEAEK